LSGAQLGADPLVRITPDHGTDRVDLSPGMVDAARRAHPELRFEVGAERRRISRGYGHEVSLDAYRLEPDFVADTGTAAGLEGEARLVREPQPPHETTPQAYLPARKPG
jgi:hypothetical protein